MATLLYRLGRFAYRRSWTVIGVWLLLLLGILGGGIALGGQTQESFAIPGTESQNALDRLDAVFPAVSGASAQAVVEVPAGASVNDPTYKAAIEKMDAAIEKIPGVDSVLSPFSEYAGGSISADTQMARTQIQFTGAVADVSNSTIAKLKDTASIGTDAGMTVAFGGQVFSDNSFGITVTEVFGLLFAAVVLLITFGSLIAAGMPLLSALIGVGIVMGGITAISAFTTVSSSAPLLALMIGLAVGIDYSLFILSRHRNQLAAGEDPEESAATAVGTAGSAVVFAGVTVIIALLGLLVVGIPFLSVMGVGAAFAVLIAIGVATTLVPALLGLAKGRLTPKPGSRAYRRAMVHDEGSKPTMGLRWVKGVMKRPILATVAVVAVLGTLAIPALSLDLNLPDGASEPKGSTQRQAYEMIKEGFGAGYNGPLIVAVDITQTTDIQPDLAAIASKLTGLDDVSGVSQGIPDAALDTAIIQVTPASAPDAPQTKALVQSIRDLGPEIEKQYHTPISVTGATAVGIDISNRLSSALIPFGAIVVGLSIILLMMVFRSVLVPLKAALGFLLSVVASFGVVVAIFQWGWLGDLLNVENPGPILSFMPILLMAVLFGLAMDYEVFLVSGMREEFVRTGDARQSVAKGFANGARVVTAAALIMFFVFFAFVPEGSGTIKPIALGLAVGIAFDAFLVRMTLVPAIMTLLGRAAWWMPKWLQRVLPNMDIEGEHLRKHREAVVWAVDKHGEAISAEGLYAGSPEHSVGPISLGIPVGALVLASGDAGDRRLVAATVAGRLDPVAGRLQVAGHPVPSESGKVARLVAMADVGGLERAETSVTLGELLDERLRLTQPWYRVWRGPRRAQRWIASINSVLAEVAPSDGVPVHADSTLDELPQRERAIALATIALAEGTPVVVLNQLDTFARTDDETAFLSAICRLAPATTTLVIGTPLAIRSAPAVTRGGRPIATIDFASLDARGVLQ
ncbi:MMPL family transporter [Glaciihabitans sp. UYNi722]|uniref:MMPL family transporter n=1 Tax=Glaciihabitans sp. UYNi722 TaxID=3156344 RepID=UPI0033944915